MKYQICLMFKSGQRVFLRNIETLKCRLEVGFFQLYDDWKLIIDRILQIFSYLSGFVYIDL